MGAGLGPYIHQDNLKFGIDTGHNVLDNGFGNRYYAGEPTTNKIPTPSANGRFTTSNSWGTYNTNRYNGNSYFSIGTISSVSSNIVTTTGNHTLRSFDVLRPQTTGGGVTAGTDYVVKKISDTQFSLHAYNGSQNGSQGYTNPTTQFFKVHDAYALDQRVSVNATSFPTMWWGAPHLPNSGLIKEIVEGGGRVPGTNCMRLHVYRGDGVADGMAYGVYTPVTAGDTITVSYWVRAATPTAANKGGSYTTYFGGNPSFSSSFTCGAYGEWVLITHQWTASVTYNFYQYWFPQGSGDIYAIDMADLQVEVNKGHSTPFVAGTRASNNSESLKDVTRTYPLDVSTVSFNSDNLITFDGTNDYIDTGTKFDDVIIGTNSFTIECIVKPASSQNQYADIWGNHYNYCGIVCQQNSTTNNQYTWGWGTGTSWATSSGNFNLTANVYNHFVAVRDGSTMRTYVNGVQVVTASNSTQIAQSSALIFMIGLGYTTSSGRYFTGDIPVLRIYSEALSASDVTKNYSGYKERFSLS